MSIEAVKATAPGRVNLIGDHTDYTGGWCLPMAIGPRVTVTGDVGGRRVRLTSDREPGLADLPLDIADPATVEPPWARYVAGVIAQLRPAHGLDGQVTATLPVGVGLSSSAALEVAVALALGADTADPVALARTCQAAEHAARGVPTGLLDQLASICGTAGHGLLLDCTALTVQPIPLPPAEEVEWVVVNSSTARDLAATGYGQRVRELRAAEAVVGPLRAAGPGDLDGLADATLRARARHVVTENQRVHAFVEAITRADLATAGDIMRASHDSLRRDFAASTPAIDDLCRHLDGSPGVFGCRMTGGGWGGAVIALARPGALAGVPGAVRVEPGAGAARA